MTTTTESDHEQTKSDAWIIDGMVPIAVAHAEAAARAAGLSIGEWLSRLLVEHLPSAPSRSALDDEVPEP